MNEFLRQFVMKAIRKMVESGSVIDDMYKQPEEAEQLDTEVNSSEEEQSATNEEENVASEEISESEGE